MIDIVSIWNWTHALHVIGAMGTARTAIMVVLAISVLVAAPLPNPASCLVATVLNSVLRYPWSTLMAANVSSWLPHYHAVSRVRTSCYFRLLAAPTHAHTRRIRFLKIPVFSSRVSDQILLRQAVNTPLAVGSVDRNWSRSSASTHTDAAWVWWFNMWSDRASSPMMAALEHIVSQSPASAGARLFHNPLSVGRRRDLRDSRPLTLGCRLSALVGVSQFTYSNPLFEGPQ